MYATTKAINRFYGMHTTFKQVKGDISKVMKELKSHSTKILQLYVKYLLVGYYKKVDTSCEALKPDHFNVGAPVVFNQKRKNVTYSYRFCNFAVLHEVRRHRNSAAPRAILIRCFERGKIIIKALWPEDMMFMKTDRHIGFISDSDILNLEM